MIILLFVGLFDSYWFMGIFCLSLFVFKFFMFFDNVDIVDYICFFFKDDKCYVFYKYYEKV